MGERLVFNGINAATGDYLTRPMTPEELVQFAAGQPAEPKEHLNEFNERVRQLKDHWDVAEGIDRRDLAQTGWGVIFAHDADPAVREALTPLLDHRRAQATRLNEQFYKEFSGPKGYRPNETKQRWVARMGGVNGPVHAKYGIPYYLLIVGDPERIPFLFQYQLDITFAVGRIHFDTLDEYHRYALSVVQAERGGVVLPRRAAFFPVRNHDDDATMLSADHLVVPLAKELAAETGWSFQVLPSEEATRARLKRLLGGDETPGLLFSASHGVSFPHGHPLQLAHQGALLCQDWPGPREWRQPVPPDFYLTGDDLDPAANPWGMLAFFFACYGAGTPQLDEFAHAQGRRDAIAPQAFLANLPRRLLAHPHGGALAVIGHVERAWGSSFYSDRHGARIETFRSTLARLLKGEPVGAAIEYFNNRYAQLGADLSVRLEDIAFNAEYDPLATASDWTENNDARSYVVVGDPAVRLMVGDAAPAARPTLDASELQLPIGTPADPLAAAKAGLRTTLDQLAGALGERQAALDRPGLGADDLAGAQAASERLLQFLRGGI
jgi:hypothetical protein